MRLTNTMRDTFVSAVMNDVPTVNYTEQINAAAMKAALDLLPPKVRAVWADSSTRHFVYTRSVQVGKEYLTLPIEYDQRVKIGPACAPLVAAQAKQSEQLTALRQKLNSVAFACHTRKALLDALPEFEKYLPPDDSAAHRLMPVVTSVVTDFVKAGWPKDKQPAKAKTK